MACNIYIFPLSTLCFATILNGCLPFTRAKRSVHDGFEQMLIKIQELKCFPGIVFAICTNQLQLPKNGRERLKPVSKTGFEETEQGFPFGTFQRGKQNRTTFLEVPLLPEVLHRNDPKSHVPFTF